MLRESENETAICNHHVVVLRRGPDLGRHPRRAVWSRCASDMNLWEHGHDPLPIGLKNVATGLQCYLSGLHRFASWQCCAQVSGQFLRLAWQSTHAKSSPDVADAPEIGPLQEEFERLALVPCQ